jgi:phosphate:Na+ symporter
MDIFSVFKLLGGLALFLYGMSCMGEKLEKLAGGRLERIFEKLTSNRFKGLLLGLGVTAIIQSSSATTVMLVGFVNSGIMKLSQAISIIMGANIGTTVTAWILSLTGLRGDSFIVQIFKPTAWSPIVAFIGMLMIMVSKSDKKKDVGGMLISFAILMYGMEVMSSSVRPLADSEKFTGILTMFTNPILGVLAGALLTAIIQSSSASVGILQMLSNSGLIKFGVAIPIIMGQNIGTCITAMLSSIGANKNAKRVAFVHLYFNIIGTIVFLSLFYILNAIINFTFLDDTISAFNIAIVHTVFNLLTTALLLPFTKFLEKLALITVRDEKEQEKFKLLDERLLQTPAVAIEHCKNITEKMSDIACETIFLSLDVMKNFDKEKADKILENENMVDYYEDKLGTYLVKIASRSLTMEDSRSVSRLLHAIGDFERISDHAVNILDTAKELNDKKIIFSEEAANELNVLYQAISDILKLTVDAFKNDNIKQAELVEPLEQVVDDLNLEMKNRHIARLQKNECTIEQGFIFSDLLTNLERVSDHCSNIAVCMIQLNKNSLNNHRYLNNLRATDEDFIKEYSEYSQKYSLPSA